MYYIYIIIIIIIIFRFLHRCIIEEEIIEIITLNFNYKLKLNKIKMTSCLN